jgi:ketosteroid isomerase-like protein
MKLAGLACVFSLALGLVPLHAADLNADEAAIRAAITEGKMPHTDDWIFWSGAYKRPFVGSEKGELFSPDAIRKNQVHKLDIQRIEVSASGDLAYEFSYGATEYDLDGPPMRHVAFKNAILRVWKKVNGEWKIAAEFARPLDTPFADATPTTAK